MRLKTIILTIACICGILSCKPDEKQIDSLDAPVLSIHNRTSSSFTVTWNAVNGAESYEYECNGMEGGTHDTFISMSGLTAGTTYTVRVRAVSTTLALSSEWAEIEVELENNSIFNLVVEAEENTLHVSASPEDKNLIYHLEVFTEELFEISGKDPELAFSTMMSDFLAYGISFDQIRMQGDFEDTFKDLKYGSTYYVLVAGIDESFNITTAVEYAEATTADMLQSDNTFTIASEEISYNSIYCEIVPSNSDPYTFILVDTEDIDRYSDEDLRLFVYNSMNPDNVEIFTGNSIALYEQGIKPDNYYSLLVFGWDRDMPTTEVLRHDIHTPEAAVGENLTFEMQARVLGETEIEVSIYPSDDGAYYYYNVISASEYAYYKDDLTQYIRDVCENVGISIDTYMKQFASVGPEVDVVFDNLTPGTPYIFFAVGVEILSNDVMFFTPQLFKGDLITEGTAPDYLVIDLQMSVTNGGTAMFVMADPASRATPYVCSLVSDEEYARYAGNIEEYYRLEADEAGFSGTFAEYIESVYHFGHYGNVINNLPADRYYLIGAGVDISNDGTVTFQKLQVSNYSLEIK